MKKLNLTEAEKWLYIGNNEFGFACLGMEDKEDKFYAQICFMFQQSIEKYLKGYLAAHNIKAKRTHDLRYLCQECSNINKQFVNLIEDCETISQYYIPSRYPAHWSTYTKKQAKESYQIAKKVIKFVKSDLKI